MAHSIKGYYVHFNARAASGVSRKIDMQMKELSRNFLMKEIDINIFKRTLTDKILLRLPFTSVGCDYKGALERITAPDFIYTRKVTADPAYVRFFKDLKFRFPKCKIIIELQDFPYDRNFTENPFSWPLREESLRNTSTGM